MTQHPTTAIPDHPTRLRLRLRPVLEALRVTDSELARRCGYSRQWVDSLLARETTRLDGGPGRGVSLATVDRIAYALGVDPMVLLEVRTEPCDPEPAP